MVNWMNKPTYAAYTKGGVPIVLLEGPGTQKSVDGEDYRKVQILPPVPQRFEWVNMKNITARRIDS
jgi:hypothetical protein